MKLLTFLYTLFLIIGVTQSAHAYESGSITIADNHKVYYEYQQPKNGKPTLVLLNGLIYSLENWHQYFNLMSDQGFGVLLIAYSTQPESLRLSNGTPYFAKTVYTFQGPKQTGISTQTLVDEVLNTIDHLGIKRFHLMSLSYGSIVGSELAKQQRHRIETLIFAAPAVLASHRYNAWGKSRHEFYKKSGASGDYYYDLEMYQSMFTLVSAGGYHFEGVEFMDFFHGVFQMGRSAKYFDLKDYASADLPPTHLFLASREDGPLLEDQLRFWELMGKNPSRGSLTMFEGGEHALPGIVPKAVAEVTTKILEGDLKIGTEYRSVKPEDGDSGTSSSKH